MIYAHFLFKLVGFVFYSLEDALDPYVLPVINSGLLTLDTLSVLFIYFAPKLTEAIHPSRDTSETDGAQSRTGDQDLAEQGSATGGGDHSDHGTPPMMHNPDTPSAGGELKTIPEGSPDTVNGEETQSPPPTIPLPEQSPAVKRLTFYDGSVETFEYDKST